jgi:Ca2+-binding RTX toxin-like protein
VVKTNGGNDTISVTGNIASLISLTIDGGSGNDTINGGNGADLLIGGDGKDFIDGNQGNDVAQLGAGDDVFRWDTGDGSDIVEGGAGFDAMVFNGNAVNETVDIFAVGERSFLQRDVASVKMDMNDVERIQSRRRHRHDPCPRPHRHRRAASGDRPCRDCFRWRSAGRHDFN